MRHPARQLISAWNYNGRKRDLFQFAQSHADAIFGMSNTLYRSHELPKGHLIGVKTAPSHVRPAYEEHARRVEAVTAPAVMDAMRSHQDNAELQMVGLRTMTRLANAKQNRKVIEKSGGKELTRRAIEIHKGNAIVEEAANEMKKYLKTWDDDSDDER